MKSIFSFLVLLYLAITLVFVLLYAKLEITILFVIVYAGLAITIKKREDKHNGLH